MRAVALFARTTQGTLKKRHIQRDNGNNDDSDNDNSDDELKGIFGTGVTENLNRFSQQPPAPPRTTSLTAVNRGRHVCQMQLTLQT